MACGGTDTHVVDEGRDATWGLAKALATEKAQRGAMQAAEAAERAVLHAGEAVARAQSPQAVKHAIANAEKHLELVRRGRSNLRPDQMSKLERKMRELKRSAAEQEQRCAANDRRRSHEARQTGHTALAKILERRAQPPAVPPVEFRFRPVLGDRAVRVSPRIEALNLKTGTRLNISGEITLTAKQQHHIATGHLHLLGLADNPRNSTFPISWNHDKIANEAMNTIIDFKTSWRRDKRYPNRYVGESNRDGVNVRIVLDIFNLTVVTFFPLSGSGVKERTV